MNGTSISLIQVFQNLANFITGQFGIVFIIVCVAATFLLAAGHVMQARSGWVSFMCGIGAYTAGWLIHQILGSAGA